MQSYTIDESKIEMPKVKFSEMAWMQYELMVKSDFTLAGKYLRLLISGKGCDGFTYSVGFTDLDEKDIVVPYKNENQECQILMDLFAAFYLQDCTIDYVQDFEQDAEGFVIINHRQHNYSGKFWKESPEIVPPTRPEI